MTATYEFWLGRNTGERIRPLRTLASFEYTRRVNGPERFSPGYGVFRLPIDNQILQDIGLLQGNPDRRIEVWRGDTGALKRLEGIFFLRSGRFSFSEGTGPIYEVMGPDQDMFIETRIVAYAAGESEAAKTDLADDMMKEVIAENLGASATDTDRDWTSLGLSIQADAGAGPSITLEYSWRELSLVLEDISQAAREDDGTMLYYGYVPVSPSSFEFRTWIGQRGKDRTDLRTLLPFSLSRNNITNPVLDVDHETEITYVYAGGEGEGAARVIQESNDSARIAASVFGRREAFSDARNASTVAAVADTGDITLSEGRPVIRLATALIESPLSRYGIHWDLGDRIAVSFLDIQFDAMIKTIHVQVDSSGREDVVGQLEWEL